MALEGHDHANEALDTSPVIMAPEEAKFGKINASSKDFPG